jgi:uncharacterized RDD family membrane protein YckC
MVASAVGWGLAGSPAKAQQRLLAGDQEALWLVRSDPARGFDVAVRPLGASWKWVAEGIPGTPQQAAAQAGTLHLVLSGRGQLMFDTVLQRPRTGLSLSHPHWPGQAMPLALAAAGSVGGRAGPLLVAVVAGPAVDLAPATHPTTAPAVDADQSPPPAEATEPVPAPATQSAGDDALLIFADDGMEWALLGQIRQPPGALADDAHAAVLDGRLYVLTVGGDRPMRLWQWSGGRSLPIALPENLPAGKPLAMVALGGRLAIVLAGEQEASAALIDPRIGQASVLRLDDAEGRPLPPSSLARQRLAVLGDQLAVLHGPTGELSLSLYGPGGHTATETVDVFAHRPEGEQAEQVLHYAMLGILLILFVVMFANRNRPVRPFVLPEQVVAGSLLKRVVAWLIDAAPFNLLAAWLFPVEGQALVRMLTQASDQQALPANAVYFVLFSITAYVAYSILAEARFAQTLGKRLMGLKVVANGGAKPHLRECVLRNLVKFIELATIVGPFLLLMALLNRYRQRLGDLLAQTAVVEAASLPDQPPQRPQIIGPLEHPSQDQPDDPADPQDDSRPPAEPDSGPSPTGQQQDPQEDSDPGPDRDRES